MTPGQLRERIEARLGSIAQAGAGIAALAAKKDPGEERTTLHEAQSTLGECSDAISKLAAALAVYQSVEFYAELPPSAALQDQGQHARDTLEYVFPE